MCDKKNPGGDAGSRDLISSREFQNRLFEDILNGWREKFSN
jgi:hypothetical protein